MRRFAPRLRRRLKRRRGKCPLATGFGGSAAAKAASGAASTEVQVKIGPCVIEMHMHFERIDRLAREIKRKMGRTGGIELA